MASRILSSPPQSPMADVLTGHACFVQQPMTRSLAAEWRSYIFPRDALFLKAVQGRHAGLPPPTPTTKKKNHEEWAVLSCKSQGLVYSTCTDALNLPTLNVLTIHRWSRPAMYCERDTWPLIKIFNNCSSQNWQKFKVTSFFNNGIYFVSA